MYIPNANAFVMFGKCNESKFRACIYLYTYIHMYHKNKNKVIAVTHKLYLRIYKVKAAL